MTLRRRGYIIEATYVMDKIFRETADTFYRQLIRFLKNRSDELVPHRSGGFSVHAKNFWRHPDAENFGVIFSPKQGSVSGGLGKAGKTNVLVFNVLDKPGELKNIANKLSKSLVVHELAHYFDPGHEKGGISKYRAAGGSGDVRRGAYFNDDSEWNAFWHEGASNYETALDSHYSAETPNKRVISFMFGDGSFRALLNKVSLFWDKAFLESMSRKTRRRFDKRFYQLWKETSGKLKELHR
jgi:hypothetical protein